MKHCLVCGSDFINFEPYTLPEYVTFFGQALQCVGSDVENFSCPVCQSFDRERHLLIFVQFFPKLAEAISGGNVLHFAPERYFSQWIKNLKPANYVKADLQFRAPDWVEMSIENIKYSDDYFDLVVANHVLEHVLDDNQAIREVTRALKPGGHAILQTPYSALLPSSIMEIDPSSEVTRQVLFGERDHFRLYGQDVFSRISRYGLRLVGGTHEQLGIAVDCTKLGINPKEPFFLFEK
jgi:SAM-dependent methyltransferase